MNVLLITKTHSTETDLVNFLQLNQVNFDIADNELVGIQKAHQNTFDIVVMDADESDQQIDQAIRILKDCNPKVRIIVRTDANSRDLECQVRKESIFYYHVNSFGNQEFTSALSSALELGNTL
ncbi:hypothetical protein EH223_17370 [candidate division KSB1 bacterium]|nr:hypothetical protein [candidate division KSB1 bacterium]RQW00918.1 MAG: hypothetical protein EH223_17370 [candidate division KSB1 bacterium]